MNQAIDLDELTLFRDMARRAFEQEITPHYEEWEAQRMVPRTLWNRLGEAGLLCPDMEEQYGGAGTSPHVTLAMIEELSELGFGGFASGYGIHNNIIAPYLSHHGTEQQKAHWLPRMAKGEVVGALAMTEPGAGSDVQGIRTHAVRDGDEWVLNGSKIFITNGIHADLVIVAAITDPGKGAKGTSLFLVDAHSPGFEKSKKIDKIGQHTSDTALLFFNDVRLPADALLRRRKPRLCDHDARAAAGATGHRRSGGSSLRRSAEYHRAVRAGARSLRSKNRSVPEHPLQAG